MILDPHQFKYEMYIRNRKKQKNICIKSTCNVMGPHHSWYLHSAAIIKQKLIRRILNIPTGEGNFENLE